jgi:hypothetical protein
MTTNYDPANDTGIPTRPNDGDGGALNYVQCPSGTAEDPRSPRYNWGAGSPNDNGLEGNIGDVYVQTDGTVGNTLWVNETGDADGWRRMPASLPIHVYDGWFLDNAAASQTNTATKRFTSSNAATNPYGTSIIVPADGIITGIGIALTGGQFGGTITFNVYDEFATGTIGVSVAFQASNYAPSWFRTNGSFDTGGYVVSGIGTAVTANQPLSFRYTSTSDLNPTTLDYTVALEITESVQR